MHLSTSVALVSAVITLLASATSAMYMIREVNEGENRQFAPTRVLAKRAFDRLEASPFEWGQLTKRYSDADEDLYSLYRAKKAFDRLDSHSFGVLKRKRAFDQAESERAYHVKRTIDSHSHRLTPLESDTLTTPSSANAVKDDPQVSISELVQQANEIEPPKISLRV